MSTRSQAAMAADARGRATGSQKITHLASWVLLAAVAPAVVGCGAGEGAGVATAVRDSVGVRIVENRAHPVPASGWRLSTEPTVSIGMLDGPEEYQLDRVPSALRLDDGTIVVANAGTNEIRFYDVEGRFVLSVGGEGEGPGEFRALGELFRVGSDSIAAGDWQLRRISLFDRNGRFGRSFLLQVPLETLAPRPIGHLGERFLVATSPFFTPESAGGVHYDLVPYLRYSMEGEPIDTLALFPGPETFLHREDRSFTVTSLAFGRATQARTLADRLYVGTQSEFQVSVYRDDGTLEQVVRLDRERRPVTDADVQRLRNRRLYVHLYELTKS